ncbi:MAG: EamA family transporter [Syntrophobacteraceae bacterium]
MNRKSDAKVRDRSEELARKTVETGRLPRRARTRFAVAMLICTGAASVGNVLLKYVFSRAREPEFGSLHQIPGLLGMFLGNGLFDLATCLLVIEFAALIYAFRYGPFSLAVPIRGALTYVFTAVLAIFFLGEQVTPWRWAAIAVIVSGITLIGISEEIG